MKINLENREMLDVSLYCIMYSIKGKTTTTNKGAAVKMTTKNNEGVLENSFLTTSIHSSFSFFFYKLFIN